MAKKSSKKTASPLEPILGLALLCLVGLTFLGVPVSNGLIGSLLLGALGIGGVILWLGWRQRRAYLAQIDDWFSRQGYGRNLAALKPREFETLIARLYEQLGYKTELTPLSGDDGIDVKAVKNGKLTIIQVKQSARRVGSPDIQTLYGSMAHALADKAVFISISGFTTDAERFAQLKNIELIDSNRLFELAKLTSQK